MLSKSSTEVLATFISINVAKEKVKVKQSHYRPGQVLRVPGG